MTTVSHAVNLINNLIWGPGMLAFLALSGLFLTFATGFVQIRRFGFMLKTTVFGLFFGRTRKRSDSGISAFQAVATAMAGTIGTGSIAGIATAIAYGGPGAVFWMWVSAFLGMSTKYCEIVLAVKFRRTNAKGAPQGGPMYYIEKGLGKRFPAILFACFTMASCLGIGNCVQSNSIAHSMQDAFGIKEYITGAVLTLIAGAVILGGMKRIANVNEKLVPAMSAVYILCCICALCVNGERIGPAFRLILSDAFSLKSAACGTGGYTMAVAMRYGFSRGIFTNEAGLGSAPIAHASSNVKCPVEQAMWGIFEVFFTTIVICTFSALVILTSDLWEDSTFAGITLSIAAFEKALPGIGGIAVTASTVFFALSTILGWGYYGEVCADYLFTNSSRVIRVYRIIYVLAVFWGAVGSLELIWDMSEALNGLMASVNIICVLALSKIAAKETNNYFKYL